MTLPTLQQLRYLVAVADQLHFGRAARVTGVSQSALSAGIAELERLLGVTLVERTQRRVLLTPAGQDVTRRARQLLVDARELVEAGQRTSRPLTGDLRLGVIPTIGPYALPRALKRLRRSYPALNLYLREEQTARVLEALRAGHLDAAWIALPYDTGDLEVVDLGSDPLLLVCPRRHHLASAVNIDDDDLARAPLLMLEDGHCLRDHALQACHLRASDTNEVFQATSLRTLVEMVAGDLGLTFVPALAVSLETAGRDDVVVRPLADGRERRIALVWRRRSAREAEYTLLAQELRAALS